MSLASPSRRNERDARDRVDEVVHQHQLLYSLVQLRLVGLLLLLTLVVRVVLVLVLGLEGSPLQRLEHLTGLAQWLPLLPLAISLCLLGGGRRRQAAEYPLLGALHRSLIPLGLACLLLLPVVSVQQSLALNQRRQTLEREQQTLLSSQMDLVSQARQAGSAADVAQLSNRAGIPLPMQAGDSLDLALWRLDQAISIRNAERLQKEPLLNLTPQEQAVMGLLPTATAVLLSAISGACLLLLHQQSRRQIQGHGLNPAQFFRADAMGHGSSAGAGSQQNRISRRSRRR